MSKPYYTLIVKYERTTDCWEIAFGDYDKETVKDERDDMEDTCAATKIIRTGDTQVEIAAEVNRLNA